MTLAQQIVAVATAKTAIKTAIELKGVPVGNSALSTYATKIGEIAGNAYARPADWLTLPVLVTTDSKFVGLHKVIGAYADSNMVAIKAAGNYTVDWGDGSALENVNANVTAQHIYDFANTYLGAETSAGWKQAIVIVTPQAGQTFTVLSLQVKHSQVGTATYSAGWVDIAVSGSLLSNLFIGSSDIYGSKVVGMGCLVQAACVNSNLTTTAYMFNNCHSLASVLSFKGSFFWASTSYMFNYCYSLASVPLFNLASVTDASSMFSNCHSLVSVPSFNLAVATTVASMFNNCYSLPTVPSFALGQVKDASSMFSDCRRLVSVPSFGFSVLTNASYMFYDCYSLASAPLFNFAFATNVSGTFMMCSSLSSVPAFNLAAATSASSMFGYCSSLAKGRTTGCAKSIGYQSCGLSATALNDVYTGLATVVTAQTISVAGNRGVVLANPTIATAKGWTVLS